jgi:hypothetical protein
MTSAYVVSALRRTIVVAVAVLAISECAFAQSAGRHVEVGGDVRWLTGVHFNDVNAVENAFGGATRTVFDSSSRFEQAACPEARVSVRLTRAIDGEGSIAFGRTQLTTRISQDPEATDATASEPVSVYMLDAGVRARLGRWRRGDSTPFVTAGAEYLRQLHDGHTLVEDGLAWYVGGGLLYPTRNAAVRGSKSAALRIELRATILPGGSTLDRATHVMPSVIAGLLFHP